VYLDWLRGFACLGMFEVHCYDAWLGGAARHSAFFTLTQFSGTVPAPLFIFLSGISTALVTDRMRRRGAKPGAVGGRIIRRGAEIFVLGLVFRAWEYFLGRPWAPRTDLLRVDVLNMIGLSIMLMGILCGLVRNRTATITVAGCASIAMALLTPPLWTTWRPHWLPWYLESYFNGVHIYGRPQPWLFPLFPWTAFAFAGLAAGFILTSDLGKSKPSQLTAMLGGAGVAMFFVSRWLDAQPLRLYSVYDYWHTNPDFFLARTGIVLVIVWGGYAWCRWGLAQKGFSPLIQLGQTSLLVYWVHIDFVYGRFSILPLRGESIAMATFGLLLIFTAMLMLSRARTLAKQRGPEILARLRGVPRVARES
jgi:uncharacterized membrane protein